MWWRGHVRRGRGRIRRRLGKGERIRWLVCVRIRHGRALVRDRCLVIP